MTAPQTRGRTEITALGEGLGDPDEAAREDTVLDAAEAFPAASRARLDSSGLTAHYVPTCLDGEFDDHELLPRLLRTVARRDVSASVGTAAPHAAVLGVEIDIRTLFETPTVAGLAEHVDDRKSTRPALRSMRGSEES